MCQVTDSARDLPVPEYREQLPRPGDFAVAIGSPLGFENSVTAGVISGLHREIPGSATRTRSLVDLIQADASISPRQLRRRAARHQRPGHRHQRGLHPAPGGSRLTRVRHPSATVIDTANELLEDGTATHPYLGISLGRLTITVGSREG